MKHAGRNGVARAALAASLFTAACGGGGTEQRPVERLAPVWFVEEGAERGLVFRHDSGAERDRYFMPEILCGGAALLDADRDGDLDAYLVQAGDITQPPAARPGNRLFANDGAGRFEDVSAASGADDRGYGMGVACGDADGDGLTDLYVTNTGPNALFVNAGELRFRDATRAAGVGHPGFGASAAFVDYDADGDLDLLTLNYVHWSVSGERNCVNALGSPDYCSPRPYDPQRDTLYRNDGDGTFTDVTAEAGLASRAGSGLGLAAADFDLDGWIDLFVANDATPNHLWRNNGHGTFVDEAVFAGCAFDRNGRSKAGMGVTVADVDDDGDPDLLVCNLRNETDSFFLNDGGAFRDATERAGLAMTSRAFTRFGMAWVDFDQDGFLDLYQANGRVGRQADDHAADPYAEPNLVFQGAEDARFEEVIPRGGTARPLIATSRAAAFGDVDGDGAIDVLVVNRDGPAHLLMNRVQGRGQAAVFSVLEASGRVALGARVEGTVAGRRVYRDVRAAYSYQASNDPRVHLGLGGHGRVEDVVVTWADGTRESFGGYDVGVGIELVRGAGE